MRPTLGFLGNAWLWPVSISAAAGQAGRGTAPGSCPTHPGLGLQDDPLPTSSLPWPGRVWATILYVGEGHCPGAHGGSHFGPGPLGLCDANTLTPPEGWPVSVSAGLGGPGGSRVPRQVVQWQMPCLAGWVLKLGTASSTG